MNISQNLRTWVEIDSEALINNLKNFQKIIKTRTQIMAVVKANAYGHGLTQIADLLAEFKIKNSKILWFGVDSIDEAIVLRKCGVKNRILILGWIPENRLPETLKHNFSFVFYNVNPSPKISSKPYKIHIKIETGTNRQGVKIEDLNGEFLKKLKNSKLIIEGLYTHFADSEDTSSFFWKTQLNRLNKAKEIFNKSGIFPKYTHCASTAASLLYPQTHFDMVRLGIGLYGLWPSEGVKSKIKNPRAKTSFVRGRQKSKIDLEPVLTWKTKIAQVKTITKGETVGYDCAYKANKTMKIAILPVGYYDGYDRGLSNKGEILINGKRARVLGRVCMNMTITDATKIKNIRVGDEVILFGGKGKNRISAEELAGKLNTINYEVAARINPLIARVIV